MTKKFTTRKNPKTGMLETIELPDSVDIENTRKELREFLHGNTQWHNDPYAKKPDPIEYGEEYQEFLDNYTLDTY